MRRIYPVCLIALLACGPMFYQAPPSLGSYPERIPVKRWHRLFHETSPPDPKLPDAKAMDETCRTLPESLIPLAREKRLAEIDRLLSENRSGPYSSARASFLHELREIAATPGLLEQAGKYYDFRRNYESRPVNTPPAKRPWDMEEDEFKALHQAYEAAIKERQALVQQDAREAPEAMKPYWLVRQAMVEFNSQLYQAAEKSFAAVAEGFPDHPRAEAAALMQARCLIELARAATPPDGDPPRAVLLDQAETLLLKFITAHPKGRFTPDAHGWLGAIAWDRQHLGSAVRRQLERLDLQPTRETTRSVLRECDRIFQRLFEQPDAIAEAGWMAPDLVFDAPAVARHPLVARLFVQHCIDPSADVKLPLYHDDGTDGGRETIDFLNRRIFPPRAVIRATLAELGREIINTRARTDASTLVLLAWAATLDGEHGQALALLDRLPPEKPSDEALHARAIVLQRLGRHDEAVAAFDRLAKDYPDSILTADIDYRRSLSWFHAGKTGRAIAAIGPRILRRTAGSGVDEAPGSGDLHDPTINDQVLQWFDTLVQFCPLDQLEEALTAVSGDAHCEDVLRNVLRIRALAAERFDIAEKCLAESPPATTDAAVWPVDKLSARHRMNRAEWDNVVAPLATLHENTTGGAGGNPAATALRIAREWMARRGQLTLPGETLLCYAASEREKQNLLRRKNALELGFPRDQVERELDARDEATHALKYAMLAAESDDPSIAAPALELANQCLFRRAEFSLYQKSRALESDDTRLSKSIHQQLVTRFPKSPEARRSVWYRFGPTAGPWMPGDYSPSNSAAALMRAIEGHPVDDPADDAQDDAARIGLILDRFENPDPKTPLPTIRKEIQKAIRDLEPLRAKADPDNPDDILNAIRRLESLRCAAALHGISTADFIAWAKGDTTALPPAFKSLLDYDERTSPATDEHGNAAGFKDDTIDGWRTFLQLYPDSPRAEAASFRMTRLIARTYRSSRMITGQPFPEAPIPNGYKHLKVIRNDTANDPQAVLTAIRDHEKRFPMGRYQDDLNLLRAGALIDEENHAEAIAILCNILDNPAQRDLHVIAALEFSDVAQRLLDPARRITVAKAMRGTPGAMNRLKRAVHGDTFLSRLEPLMPWLESPARP